MELVVTMQEECGKLEEGAWGGNGDKRERSASRSGLGAP